MKLSEIGNLLREERFSRGLYIEDVASKLKISPRILRALESGDNSDLPHHVYTKGFIKSYGNYLGFTHEELILDEEDLGQNSIEEFVIPVQAKSRRTKLPLLLIIAALAIGVTAGAFYYTNASQNFDFSIQLTEPVQDVQPPATQDPNTQTSVSIVQPNGQRNVQPNTQPNTQPNAQPNNPPALEPIEASAEQIINSTNTNLVQANDTNLANVGTALATNTVTPQQESQANIANSSEQSTTSSTRSSSLLAAEINETNTEPVEEFDESKAVQTNAFGVNSIANRNAVVVEKKDVIPNGMHQAVIIATEDCWIKSTADKTDTREFILKKGETFALTFKSGLDLRLGNAGGVTIRYDGQELGAPGKIGQVLTYKLPPQ